MPGVHRQGPNLPSPIAPNQELEGAAEADQQEEQQDIKKRMAKARSKVLATHSHLLVVVRSKPAEHCQL